MIVSGPHGDIDRGGDVDDAAAGATEVVQPPLPQAAVQVMP